jgi:hypothetical protein
MDIVQYFLNKNDSPLILACQNPGRAVASHVTMGILSNNLNSRGGASRGGGNEFYIKATSTKATIFSLIPTMSLSFSRLVFLALVCLLGVVHARVIPP